MVSGKVVVLTVSAYILLPLHHAVAQTFIQSAATAVYQSAGSLSGTSYDLSSNGYVGTYFKITQPTSVTFTVNAAGQTADGQAPAMVMGLDGMQIGKWNVNSGVYHNYTVSKTLQPGTYNFEAQVNNETPTSNRSLLLNSFTFSAPAGSGLEELNPTNSFTSNVTPGTEAVLNTYANDAADTYIRNYRTKSMTLIARDASGQPLPAGTTVEVKLISQLTNSNFAWGTAVSGTTYTAASAPNMTPTTNSLLFEDPTKVTGGTPQDIAATQQAINETKAFVPANFNALEAENAGKWPEQEATQGTTTLQLADAIVNYAQQHGMSVRMHNIIWGHSQPAFVNTLFNTITTSNNPTAVAAARSALDNAISSRIQYDVAQRAQGYSQIDVLNEATRTRSPDDYYGVYGTAGIAAIYNEVKQAVTTSGGNAKLFTNEYNVLQDSTDPSNSSSSDPYASWYLNNEVNAFNQAGQATGNGNVVGGIGIQYYALFNSPNSKNDALNTGRIYAALQNMSVAQLPLALTEFGVNSYSTTFDVNYDPNVANIADINAAKALAATMRMVFGTPSMNTFQVWGFLKGYIDNQSSQASALVDKDNNLTLCGEVWQTLLGINDWSSQLTAAGIDGVTPWTTDLTLVTGAGGKVTFNGFAGQYMFDAGGMTSNVDLSSVNEGTVSLMPEPASALVSFSFLFLLRRKRKPSL